MIHTAEGVSLSTVSCVGLSRSPYSRAQCRCTLQSARVNGEKGAVKDFEFFDLEAPGLGQNREKAVETSVDLELLDALGRVGFEAAVHVVQ